MAEARLRTVNADDFGLSSAVNAAITQAFDLGLITSTSIMANMPGFEEACAIARQRNLNGKIGVHLNLTEGSPLTIGMRSAKRLVTDDGQFRFALPRSTLVISRQESAAVKAEWDAQIRRCIEHGVVPAHLDSHHHVHAIWPLLSITVELARKHGIGQIRVSRNLGVPGGILKSAYKTVMNRRLKLASLARSDYFASVSELNEVPDNVELMVHPVIENGVLVDTHYDGTPNPPLADEIKRLGLMPVVQQ